MPGKGQDLLCASRHCTSSASRGHRFRAVVRVVRGKCRPGLRRALQSRNKGFKRKARRSGVPQVERRDARPVQPLLCKPAKCCGDPGLSPGIRRKAKSCDEGLQRRALSLPGPAQGFGRPEVAVLPAKGPFAVIGQRQRPPGVEIGDDPVPLAQDAGQPAQPVPAADIMAVFSVKPQREARSSPG